MNSGEQPLVDGASPCLALLLDQQPPQTMMLRLSSRFALRTTEDDVVAVAVPTERRAV